MFWFSFLVTVLIRLNIIYVVLENFNTLVESVKIDVVAPTVRVPDHKAKRTDTWP
jgi:hypothetical protein